jgi:phosphate transport system substrate-binding protein
MIVNSPNPTAFPIAGFTWVLVYQDQSNAAAGQTLASLLWWMTHDAQAMAATLDYAQLSPAAQQSAEAQIRLISSGGQPILP